MNKASRIFSGVAVALSIGGCADSASIGSNEARAPALVLTSSAFSHNGDVPARHTCDDENVVPPLSWTGAPPQTKSLVLIVDDPDAPDPKAPRVTWVHWVLYNLPPTASSLPDGVAMTDLPAGVLHGVNDWNRIGYRGPCPPIGRHRYFHKLYALDVVLPDLGKPDKKQIEQAMQGHIIAEGLIIGMYQRKR